MGNNENLEMTPYAVKNGVILGLVGSALAMAMYIIHYTLIVNWKFQVISLITSFALVIYFGSQYRKAGSGFLSYGKAFKLTFFILIVSGVLNISFQIFLFHVLDPELPALLTKEHIANMERFSRWIGAQQSQIDEQTRKLERDLPAEFSLIGQLKSSWAIVVFSAIIALIASIFIKKNEPVMG